MPPDQEPLVSIIDDDSSIRRSLTRILKSVGYRTETFDSAMSFLENGQRPNCLLLDITLPGMSGLDLQTMFIEGNLDTPIVFITGQGKISLAVKAMKSGAVDFLEKPFQDKDLFRAVRNAIEKDHSARASENSNKELRHKIYSLTPREHEVLTFVISGLPNKAIAVELGASEKTIKVHRGRFMHKIGASSIVELIRLADKAGIQPVFTKT